MVKEEEEVKRRTPKAAHKPQASKNVIGWSESKESGWTSSKNKDVTRKTDLAFKKFIWDRKTVVMETFSDTDYSVIGNLYLNVLPTAAGFPLLSTAWTDEAAAGATAWNGLIEEAVMAAFRGGSQKDIVIANQQAFINYTITWMLILWELVVQNYVRGKHGNLTLSDTARSGNQGPYVFTKNSWDVVLSHLTNIAGIAKIPQASIAFVSLLMMYIQRTEPYVQGSQRIPGSFFMPWTNSLTFLTLFSNSTSAIHMMQSYLGEARIYIDKHNEPTTIFDVNMLDTLMRKVDDSSQDWLALMNAYPVVYEGTAVYYANCFGDMTTDSAGAYQNRRYFFYSSKPSSWIHRLHKLLSKYNATHNVLGYDIDTGNPTIFACVPTSGINKVSLCVCSYLGTAYAEETYMGYLHIMNNIPALVTGDQTNVYVSRLLTGGAGTPIKMSEVYHPLMNKPDIMYGATIGQTEVNNLVRGFFISLFTGEVNIVTGGRDNARDRRHSFN